MNACELHSIRSCETWREHRVEVSNVEEAPLSLKRLSEAQAHDGMVYPQSTAGLLPKGDARPMRSWNEVIFAEDAFQAGLLQKLALRMRWLRHLPNKRKPWGRDLITARAAAAFLFAWARPTGIPVANAWKPT